MKIIKNIKCKLFCEHHYELNRWHRCHGPNAMDPPMIEAEYICVKCGKIRYYHDSIENEEIYKSICDAYERRIK